MSWLLQRDSKGESGRSLQHCQGNHSSDIIYILLLRSAHYGYHFNYRNSEFVKSFEEKVGSAYDSVKVDMSLRCCLSAVLFFYLFLSRVSSQQIIIEYWHVPQELPLCQLVCLMYNDNSGWSQYCNTLVCMSNILVQCCSLNHSIFYLQKLWVLKHLELCSLSISTKTLHPMSSNFWYLISFNKFLH